MINQPQKLQHLLQQFYDECLILRNHSVYTINWYKRTVGHFCKIRPEIQHLQQLTKESIEDFLYEGRLKRNWKVSTFINYYGGFRCFFKWCMKKGYIRSNPMDQIERPKKEKTLPKALSQEKAQKILETAFHAKYTYKFQRHRNRALFAIILFSGLRIRECIELRLNDVDIENNSILIHQGKGHKDRMLPISPQLKIYLISYLQERDRLKKNHLYFFSSTNRNRPLEYHGIKKIIYFIREKTNIHFTPHMLRHTFATLMLEGGCDIYSLSKMMGHTDIKTTTIYLSASAQHLRNQIYKHPLNSMEENRK